MPEVPTYEHILAGGNRNRYVERVQGCRTSARVNARGWIQPSARAAENGVALGQEVAIGLEVVGARHVDAPALKAQRG